MLHKGKNETLSNYIKRYWELYNKIEEYSEALAMVSYKLGLTGRETMGRLDAQLSRRSPEPHDKDGDVCLA